jgi:hypothetical protein
VSDIVVDGELPETIRQDMLAYVGCLAGALEKTEYERKLTAAGFVEVGIEPTRRYTFADLEGTFCFAESVATLSAEEREATDGRVMSAFIRASKPSQKRKQAQVTAGRE